MDRDHPCKSISTIALTMIVGEIVDIDFQNCSAARKIIPSIYAGTDHLMLNKLTILPQLLN